ncbi:MAG: PAS domain-containing sensor histidine kinase [Campylobacterota bacterium]|nr:PAS domain-containing sensor histidine kinase [Campylobacterota bacterium]
MVSQHFLIAYECISSIGNSLDLDKMLKEFLKTVIKKTSASGAKVFLKSDLTPIVSINKDSTNINIKNLDIDYSKECSQVIEHNGDTIILICYEEIICVINYKIHTTNLEQLSDMFLSFSQKLNRSVEACNVFIKYKNIKDSLQLAIDGSNDGLWDWDIITDKVYFSKRWKNMLGYEVDELSHNMKEWSSRIHPDDKIKVRDNIKKYLNREISSFEIQYRIKHKSGKYLWVLNRAKAFFEDEKPPMKMIGFHTDITEQKDLEETLEHRVHEEVEKNKKKDAILQQQSRLARLGEMISMIAHQWRQPLSSISSTIIAMKLKLALNKFDLDSKDGQNKFTDYLDLQLTDIEELVEVLTTTIDDFRNFYKTNKTSTIIQIQDPIQKSLTIIKAQLEIENIEIKENYTAKNKLPLFANELMQVFLNILKNSSDNFKNRINENKFIEIETSDINENGIKIIFTDNGGGIDENIIKKIFDPYFSTKDEKNGTGLGLYMSKIIVEQHHKGKLNAENNSDGVSFIIEVYS